MYELKQIYVESKTYSNLHRRSKQPIYTMHIILSQLTIISYVLSSLLDGRV